MVRALRRANDSKVVCALVSAALLVIARASSAQVSFDVLHGFSGVDGAYPRSLVRGTDGVFYGTTTQGGLGYGTVIKVDTDGTVTVLHEFTGIDGSRPPSGVIQARDGVLYGVTATGGTFNSGTVFRLDVTGSEFNVLHSFGGVGEMYQGNAAAGLVQGSDGAFYGTTTNGGLGSGTVFRIDGSGATTQLHRFVAETDGWYVIGALVQGSDGALYGTTVSGGAAGFGTIFRIDTTGEGFTVLHHFAGPDSGPHGARGTALVEGHDGAFYGMTNTGGSGYGTVFMMNAAGAVTLLHSFGGSDGGYPGSALIQGSDGAFYGTAPGGGTSIGAVFRIDASGAGFSVLHTFPIADGALPPSPLSVVEGSDGAFYGTTVYGGTADLGTVFRLRIVQNTSTGSNVAVTPSTTLPDGSPTTVSMTFADVLTSGETTVTTSTSGPPPPAGFKLTSPPVYYNLTTTATFAGSVQVCLSWVEGQVANEENVRLFHFENSVWTDITDSSSRNSVTNTICGITTSLSPFTLGETKYAFAGFFQPVDNLPAVNLAKAGAAVPVKFSLGGALGLGVIASDYPRSQLVRCDTGAPLAAIEETVTAGASSLTFDATTDRYIYVWKTDRLWSGTCRQLQVRLTDGEIYRANFSFTR